MYTVIVVHSFSIPVNHVVGEYLQWFDKLCRCNLCCQGLLYRAILKWWDYLRHEVSTCPAFELFLSIIPTRSSNPTAYLPRFSPLWAPDKALNPITSDLIFHLFPFTSIQWAVIPRNAIFVVSADHPSAVIDTFPGAAYSSNEWWVIVTHSGDTGSGLPLCLASTAPYVLWIHCEYVLLHHMRSEGQH